MKSVAIMFEASYLQGVGHAMRCMVLADALQREGWDVTLVTNKGAVKFCDKISSYKNILYDEFIKTNKPLTLLIIDQYNIGYEQEVTFRKFAKNIMVIDELVNRNHDCDLLLDQNYGREQKDYLDRVPKHCNILTGCNYALLRPEFSKMRDDALQKRKKTFSMKNLLINFGGADQKNVTCKILGLLDKSEYAAKINIVLGFSSKYYDEVKRMANILKNEVYLHENANMADLMLQADLCVGASGSTSYERACLGLPSMVVETASNQTWLLKSMHENKLCIHIKNDFSNFINKLNLFVSDWANAKRLSNNVSQLCDGRGVTRVIRNIEELISEV